MDPKGELNMMEKKWRLNDTFAQYWRNIKPMSEDIVKRKKKNMECCNHLFVRLNGLDIYGSKNIMTVECVYCGITNKFLQLEEFFNSNPRIDSLSLPKNTKTLQSEMFMQMLKQNHFQNDQNFHEFDLKFMSEEILPTYHPGLLYQLALQIKFDASIEEIFDLMKQLHALETNTEVLHLQTLEQANELFIRYQESVKKNYQKS